MLSLVGTGGGLRLLGPALAVVALTATSCTSGRSDRLSAPAQQVAVGGRSLTIAREPNDICVQAPLRSDPSCVPLEFPLSEAVFGAVLEPLDTKADLLVVVTPVDTVLEHLPSGAVHTVIGPRVAGESTLGVWLALPPAGTSRVCATARGLPDSQGFQVYRAVETPAGGEAEVAVDDC